MQFKAYISLLEAFHAQNLQLTQTQTDILNTLQQHFNLAPSVVAREFDRVQHEPLLTTLAQMQQGYLHISSSFVS